MYFGYFFIYFCHTAVDETENISPKTGNYYYKCMMFIVVNKMGLLLVN